MTVDDKDFQEKDENKCSLARRIICKRTLNWLSGKLLGRHDHVHQRTKHEWLWRWKAPAHKWLVLVFLLAVSEGHESSLLSPLTSHHECHDLCYIPPASIPLGNPSLALSTGQTLLSEILSLSLGQTPQNEDVHPKTAVRSWCGSEEKGQWRNSRRRCSGYWWYLFLSDTQKESLSTEQEALNFNIIPFK